MRSTPPLLAALIAVGGLSASAGAQILLRADFEPPSDPARYGYTYSDTGNQTQTSAITAGVGVGGGSGFVVTADFTNASGGFAGVGVGVIGLYDGAGDVSPFTAAPVSASDLTYAFSLAATGLNADVTTTGASGELTFFAPDDTLGVDAGTENDVLLRYTLDRAVPADGTFADFSGDFGTETPSGGSFATLQQFFASVNRVQFQSNFGGGTGRFVSRTSSPEASSGRAGQGFSPMTFSIASRAAGPAARKGTFAPW